MLDHLSIRKAVQFAIETEELGARMYTKLATRFSADEELAALFAKLADEEHRHQRQFEKLFETVPDEQGSAGAESWQYLRAMSISAFFGGRKGLFREVDQIEDREDALLRAIGLEKATVQFFEAMRDVLGQEETLEAIIKVEKGHVLTLMNSLITGAKVRSV